MFKLFLKTLSLADFGFLASLTTETFDISQNSKGVIK